MDKKQHERMFYIDDSVNILNFQEKPKKMSGVLEEQIGSLMF